MTAENVKKQRKTGGKAGLGDRRAPFWTGWARLSRTCEFPVSSRRCFGWGPPPARDFFALLLPLAVVGVNSGRVVFCKFSGATPDSRFCPPCGSKGKPFFLKKKGPKTQPTNATKFCSLLAGPGLGYIGSRNGTPAITMTGDREVSHRGPTRPLVRLRRKSSGGGGRAHPHRPPGQGGISGGAPPPPTGDYWRRWVDLLGGTHRLSDAIGNQ